uniref:Uncharacterized protein n=1 Tax=candidate division WOR-3 bacterium TaxID=2052148 RepID=A0A7C4GG78_UNCW3
MRYLVLLLGSLTVALGQPEFSGEIVKPDTARFSITTQSDPETWKFDIPDDAYFWMKIDDENGKELADVRLQTSRYVMLNGGGKFSFRLYTVGGDGPWSAKRISGSGTNPHIVSKPTAKPASPKTTSGGSTATPTSSGGFEGRIVEPDTARFSITTQSDPETWKFDIPSDAYFWMKIDDENGMELADVRLQTSCYVKLVGGGRFSCRLYTVGGDGPWSAKRISGSGTSPHIVSKPTAKPASSKATSGNSTATPTNNGGFTGKIVEPDTARFSITTQSDPETWKFDIPDNTWFWMKIDDENGTELADVRLHTIRYVKLVGGGRFSCRLYTVGGGGPWSAKRMSEDVAGAHHEITPSTANYHCGYLEESLWESFAVKPLNDPESWTFYLPENGRFWVEVYNRNGDEIGDFDLSKGETIELRGGGIFKMRIRCIEGSGYWEARRD